LVGVPDDTVNERGYPEVNRDAVTKGKWEIDQPHFITEGLPLELLPEGSISGSFYQYKARGDVLIKSGSNPIVAVKNYGKGRVVAMAYVEEGFTPQSINPTETRIYWDYWEYQYSLLARCLLWAAGRETPVHIKSLSASAEGLSISLLSANQQSVKIEIDGKNEFGQALGKADIDKVLTSGPNTINISAATLKSAIGLPGGRQIFNVIQGVASGTLPSTVTATGPTLVPPETGVGLSHPSTVKPWRWPTSSAGQPGTIIRVAMPSPTKAPPTRPLENVTSPPSRPLRPPKISAASPSSGHQPTVPTR
jgi:hypothetical protein